MYYLKHISGGLFAAYAQLFTGYKRLHFCHWRALYSQERCVGVWNIIIRQHRRRSGEGREALVTAISRCWYSISYILLYQSVTLMMAPDSTRIDVTQQRIFQICLGLEAKTDGIQRKRIVWKSHANVFMNDLVLQDGAELCTGRQFVQERTIFNSPVVLNRIASIYRC